MIQLDTNVLLRFAKVTDPAFPVVDAALNTLVALGNIPVIVPQNAYEFWTRLPARWRTTGWG